MSKETTPINFELSTSPTGAKLWVPRKSRDPKVIEVRRGYVDGELVLREQADGMPVLHDTFADIDPEDINSLKFAALLISTSLYESGYHTSAEPQRRDLAGRRRRNLKLPRLYEFRTVAELQTHMLELMDTAAGLAVNVANNHAAGSPRAERSRFEYGLAAGNAALVGACIAGIGDGYIPGSPARAQQEAREYGFRMSEGRFALAQMIGSSATAAQFADQDSDVARYWRDQAPDGAYQAYAQALAR